MASPTPPLAGPAAAANRGAVNLTQAACGSANGNRPQKARLCLQNPWGTVRDAQLER